MTTLTYRSPRRSTVILAYPKIDHEKDYTYFWMPFSLLTIAKPIIDQQLAEVVIFDGNQQGIDAWERLLDDHLDDALCIGVSVMTGGGQIAHALEMVRAAKRRDQCPPVVFGGPHVNVLAEQTVDHELVDIALVGPGQNSMPALIQALVGESRLEDTPGALFWRDKELVRGPTNPARTGVLGDYPWHLIDVASYIRDDPTIATRTLNYVSSQGCVYKCQFCYELTYQRKYSAMEAHSMIHDVISLQERYGLNGVKFYDADWFVNLRRAGSFCDELIERDLDLSWAASINPNDVLKARRSGLNLLEKLEASGCKRLLMGVESGSDRVLRDVIRKEITRAQIIDVASNIADHGILGSYTFIVGFPGETPAEQEETYSLMEELRALSPRPETRVHLFAPYPGTPLFEASVQAGYQPPTALEHWAHYDYYDSQTPWTDSETVRRARSNTQMRLSPTTGGREPDC